MISTGKINLNAHTIDNRRGAIVSLDHLSLQASEDIDSRAGILAGKQITLAAEQDINLQSQSQTSQALSGSLTTLDGLSRIQAEQLEVRAKADLNLAATHVEVSQAATLEAGHDLTLGTVATVEQQQLTWDAQNSLSQSRKAEVGTLMQTGGSLELKAGHDIHATGVYVHAGAALSAKAGRDIKLEAAYEERAFAESRHHEFNHLLSSSSESSQTQQYKKQALNSTFSGGTVKMEAGHDLSATGSNIVGMHAMGLYADNDIKLKAAKQIEQASYHSVEERSGLLDNGSLGYTIGEREQKEALESESTPYIGTIIGSVTGQVEAIAGREYQQSGSQLVAPEGNIRAKALKGTVDAVYEQGRRWQHSEWHQSGLTVSVSAPVIAAAQTGQQMLQASRQVSDPRMSMLAAGTIALGAENAYDAIQADPKTAGGVTVSVMMGESHQESQQTQRSTTALGSTITAGGTVQLEMEGLGEASTLNIIVSQIEAKQDVQLKVPGPLTIEAAPNTFIQHSEQHNQSSAAGLAATLGSHSSMGAAVAISSGRGHADGVEISHTPVQIKAGRKLMLDAQSNVHLKGAQLSGQQVQANIEGDLEIESVQNASAYHSRYQSISGSATAGPASAASVNFSQQKINSHYLSVAEQAGIQAGEGGFQIGVKGDTKLAGGVIASTDQAIEEGKNKFVTGTLAISDIENQARYNANSLGLGIGYSKDGKGVGSSQGGQAITPAHKGNQLTTSKGASAAMPIAISASGQATSTTQSAISGAQIVITNEQRQEALTGRSAEETIASLNRNPTHGHQALETIFNKTEIEAGFEIVGALGREANAFIANRAREADRKVEQAEYQEALANENELMSIEQRQALYETATELRSQAQALNKQWGPGGTYRRVLTAITAAASGNVTGATAQFVQSGVLNLIQQQGASHIGEMVKSGAINEGSPAHAALHALVGLGGAAASNQSMSAGAIGGAVSSILTHAFSPTHPDETRAEQEAKHNIATTLVAGVAALTGADTTVATHSAAAAIDNNWLATEQKALIQKELKACEDDFVCKSLTALKWTGVSAKQDVLFGAGFIDGVGDSGWEILEGIVELGSHPIKTVNGLITLVKSEDMRAQVGEAIVAEWDAKMSRVEVAIAEGGDQHAMRLGRDVGNLFFQAFTTIIAAGGAIKLTASLGKAGIHVGHKTLEQVSRLSKFENLAKAGGTLEPNKPLLDSGLLVTKQAIQEPALPNVQPQSITTAISSKRLSMQLAAEQAAGVRMPTELIGYSRHGINHAISREGTGVNPKSILDAWRNPIFIKHFSTEKGPTFRLVGENATIVINPKGEVVTMWSRSKIGARQ